MNVEEPNSLPNMETTNGAPRATTANHESATTSGPQDMPTAAPPEGSAGAPAAEPTNNSGDPPPPPPSLSSTDEKATPSTSTENTPSWDHSDRRVLLQGVNKYLDGKSARKEMKRLVEDTINKSVGLSLEIDNVKKPPRESWLRITFTKAEMVQPFIDYVNSNDIKAKKGRRLHAKRVEGSDAKIEKKRKAVDDSNAADDDRGGKRSSNNCASSRKGLKEVTRRPVTEEEIKNKICPLWNLSYEEQIDRKLKDMVRKSCLKIIQEIKSKFRTLEKEQRKKIPFYYWMAGKRSIDVEDVVPVPSPIRNKVEFTFGYRYLFDEASTTTPDEQQSSANAADPPKVPAVGFLVLGWAGGVSRPHCCPNIGSEFSTLSDLVDSFLKDSPLPPYDTVEHTGFWRFLTIRASRRTRECMVIITHSPASGGQGEDADRSTYIDMEKNRLVEILKNADLPIPDQDPIRVTSVFFQEFEGLSSPGPDDPVQLAYGKPHLTERLGKCIFNISPGAFFQVNTVGAEILYQRVVEKVREVSDDPKNTLLFDVCCGTGTIGLTCMKEGVVGKVIGIDLSEPAIEDAKKNAEANGYKDDSTNKPASLTRFVAARAEHVMSKEIGKAGISGMNFVAVVDPAREGLHADVLRALRATEKIRRIVYVSCNPTGSLIKDSVLLCCPATKKYTGTPFRVESAKPVDMFPLTAHCEMVMTFDRITESDKVEPKNECDAAVVKNDATQESKGADDLSPSDAPEANKEAT